MAGATSAGPRSVSYGPWLSVPGRPIRAAGSHSFPGRVRIMWTVVRSVLAAAVLTAVLGGAGPPPASGQQKKGADKAGDGKAGAALFEVYTDKGGKFRFRLTEGDEVLAIAGHGYATKQ